MIGRSIWVEMSGAGQPPERCEQHAPGPATRPNAASRRAHRRRLVGPDVTRRRSARAIRSNRLRWSGVRPSRSSMRKTLNERRATHGGWSSAVASRTDDGPWIAERLPRIFPTRACLFPHPFVSSDRASPQSPRIMGPCRICPLLPRLRPRASVGASSAPASRNVPLRRTSSSRRARPTRAGRTEKTKPGFPKWGWWIIAAVAIRRSGRAEPVAEQRRRRASTTPRSSRRSRAATSTPPW